MKSLSIQEKEGAVKIYLMRGVLYRDEQPEIWNNLLCYRNSVKDWFEQVGLEVYLDETEGHAFLQQTEWEEGDSNALHVPPMIIRRPLSYQMSLLCVLLHKKLIEHDTHQSGPCVVTRGEIVEMMKVYLPASKTEAKLVDDIYTYIKKAVVQLGFLRQLKDDVEKFEIRRIVKAFIDAQNLANFNNLLKGVVKHETDGSV